MKIEAMKMVKRPLVQILVNDVFVKVSSFKSNYIHIDDYVILFAFEFVGGEVKCNDISCYIRKDCEPRYIKGVCCPQYDNCPPLST